jgi:maltose alpha-D-glucosyltransferase/alpha-amylase
VDGRDKRRISGATPRALQPVIDDPVYGYQRVNVESQQGAEGSLLHTIRRMILTRKRLDVLARGELEWLDSLPKEALCFWRKTPEGALLALHNLSERPLSVPIAAQERLVDALDSGTATTSHIVELPPYGYRWLLSATSGSG